MVCCKFVTLLNSIRMEFFDFAIDEVFKQLEWSEEQVIRMELEQVEAV